MDTLNHLVLLGDSIFDNGKYVSGGPAVIDQVKQRVPTQWCASTVAVDGDTASMAVAQVGRIPGDATHLILSVGGNDALGCIQRLESPAATVKQGLMTLTMIQASFRASYENLIATLCDRNLMVCTIYDSVPNLPKELRTALGLFNDVILQVAIRNGLPVLDLRMVCTEPDDYSVVSPIEPSSVGGAKIADGLVRAVTQHDFALPGCRVYI